MVGEVADHGAGRHLAARHGEDPVAGGRHRVRLGGDGGGVRAAGAQRQQHLDGTLHVQPVRVRVAVEAGGEAALGGEGDLQHQRMAAADLVDVEGGLGREHQEGEVDRVAGDAAVAVGGAEGGAVAERGAVAEVAERGVGRLAGRVVADAEPALDGEALALDRDAAMAGQPDQLGGELVDGEGACLVENEMRDARQAF